MKITRFLRLLGVFSVLVFGTVGASYATSTSQNIYYKISIDHRGGTGFELTGNPALTVLYERYGPSGCFIAAQGLNTDDFEVAICIWAVERLPTRLGHTFQGYYYYKDGTEHLVIDTNKQFVASPSLFTSPGQIYAKWVNNSPTVYSIDYITNGGDNHPSNPYTFTSSDLPLTISGTPTREHSTFLGWCDDAALSQNCSVTKTITSVGNKTFYAKWDCPQPYIESAEGDACFSCNDGEYYDDTSHSCLFCKDFANGKYPYSRAPFNNRQGQCFGECQDKTCDDYNPDPDHMVKMHPSSNQISFYGNIQAGINACSQASGCAYMYSDADNLFRSSVAFKPRASQVDFYGDLNGDVLKGTRYAVGCTTAGCTGPLTGYYPNVWSELMGPAQGYDDNSPYKFVIYSSRLAPNADIAGYRFNGYYSSTGALGSQYVNQRYLLTNSAALSVLSLTETGGVRNLYAQYTQIQNCSFEYDCDPGSGTVASGSVNIGQTYTVSSGAGCTAPNGQTFSHWVYNGDTYNPGATYSCSAGMSVTFNAVYTANTVTINWDENGGSTISQNGSCVYNTEAFTVPAVGSTTWAGHILLGWKLNGQEGVVSPGQNDNWCNYRNLGVYDGTSNNVVAQWQVCPAGTYQNGNRCDPCDAGYESAEGATSCTPISYNVTYSCGAGTGTAPTTASTATYNASYTPAANTCTKSGYTFAGWTVSNTGTPGDVKPAGTAFTWTYTEDKTLTATWTVNTYNIVYSCGDGSGTAPSGSPYNSVTHGDPYTVASQGGCLYTDHDFVGWQLNTGDNYEAGEPISQWNHAANNGDTFTFTAVWSGLNSYMITYHTYTGTLSATGCPIEFVPSTGASLTSCSASRSNSAFGGWCLNSATCAQAERVTSIPANTNQDVDLYAQWTCNTPGYHMSNDNNSCDANQYTINYNCGTGASGNPSTGINLSYPGTHTVLANTVPANTCNKTDYGFNGWVVSSTGDSASYGPFNAGNTFAPNGSNGAVYTLTASWVPTGKCTYTYNCGAGNGSGYVQYIDLNQSGTVLGFNAVNCSVPSYSSFDNWKDANNNTVNAGASIPTCTTAASYTLTAQYTPAQIVINYQGNGGSDVSNDSCTYGGALNVTSTVPTKSGYLFNGWRTSDVNGTVLAAGDSIAAADEGCTIKYLSPINYAGGTYISTGLQAQYCTACPTNLSAAHMTSCSATANNNATNTCTYNVTCVTNYTVNGGANQTDTVTGTQPPQCLYVQPAQGTIRYETYGGTMPSGADYGPYNQGTTVTINAVPTRNDDPNAPNGTWSVFEGWCKTQTIGNGGAITLSNCSNNLQITIASGENVVYAKWSCKQSEHEYWYDIRPATQQCVQPLYHAAYTCYSPDGTLADGRSTIISYNDRPNMTFETGPYTTLGYQLGDQVCARNGYELNWYIQQNQLVDQLVEKSGVSYDHSSPYFDLNAEYYWPQYNGYLMLLSEWTPCPAGYTSNLTSNGCVPAQYNIDYTNTHRTGKTVADVDACPDSFNVTSPANIGGCYVQGNAGDQWLGWCIGDATSVDPNCTIIQNPAEINGNHAQYAVNGTLYLHGRWNCAEGYHADGDACVPNTIYLQFRTSSGNLPSNLPPSCQYDSTFNMPGAVTGLAANQAFEGWNLNGSRYSASQTNIPCTKAVLGVSSNTVASPVYVDASIATVGQCTYNYACTPGTVKSGATTSYTINVGQTHNVPLVNNICERTGYAGRGWDGIASGVTRLSCTASNIGVRNFTATYNKSQYKAIYDCTSGDVSIASFLDRVKYEDYYTFLDNTLGEDVCYRSGYQLDKWSGDGGPYSPGQQIQWLWASNKTFTVTWAQCTGNTYSDATHVKCTECPTGTTANAEHTGCDEPVIYTITYKPNYTGASQADQTQEVEYETNFTTKPGTTFTRSGWIMTGWSEPFPLLSHSYSYNVNGHTSLRAQWERCVGTSEAGVTSCTISSNNSNLCTAVAECGTGYNTPTGSCDGTNCTCSCSPDSSQNTITYNQNGGTWASGASHPGAYTPGTAQNYNAYLARDNSVHKGWCRNAALTQSCSTDKKVYITATDVGPLNFYAKYECDSGYTSNAAGTACVGAEYAVTYACGDGATGPAPTANTATYNASYTPAANTCSKSGYVFGGWAVSNTGTPGDVKPAGTAFTWTYTEDKTLTATWTDCPVGQHPNATYTACETNSYNLNYSCGDGAGTLPASGTVQHGGIYTVANNVGCVYAGHSFQGWDLYLGSAYITQYNAGTVINPWNRAAAHNSTFTFKARWTTCPTGTAYYNGECLELCDAGVTKMVTSEGPQFNLFKIKKTSPALHVLYNDKICYIQLESGQGGSGKLNLSDNNGHEYYANPI